MDIKNGTFVVSGGASGLGAACARMIVANGGKVVLADLDQDKGKALETELGDAATFVPTDVTKTASVAEMMNRAHSFGTLRGGIQCAGIGHAEKIVGKNGAHEVDAFVKVITVNLIGTFQVLRAVAEKLCEATPTETGERGVLICTASVAAFEGQIGQIAYSASKGGVAGMTLPAARDLAKSGVRVVTIAPGIFDTPLLAGLPGPARKSLAEQVPFPSRLGQPSEFANLAKHIIENVMLNGEVIRLDGALRMAPR